MAALIRDGEENDEEDEVEESETKIPKRIIGVWRDDWPSTENKTLVSSKENIPGSISDILNHARQQQSLSNVSQEEISKEKEEINTNVKVTYQEINSRKFKRAGEQVEEPKEEPKKQHTGLRCKKCFCLLARDADFEYKNGTLWIHPRVFKESNWEGLITKGGTVYCQNMHPVGQKESTTWTNETVFATVLKVDKTTFMENFVKNPAFAGTDMIKNKLRFNEHVKDNLLIQLSVSTDPKFLPDPNSVADRYYSK